MTTEPQNIEQHEYETIDSAISRALNLTMKGHDMISLKCTYDNVHVSIMLRGDYSYEPEQIKEVLQQAADRAKQQAESKAAIPPELEGVPGPDEHVPWKSLHPTLREVVLSNLRTARARYAQQIAEGSAQTIATMAAMSGLIQEQSGPEGSIMAASMTEGMARTLKGSNDGKVAVCAAYDVAIAELEAL